MERDKPVLLKVENGVATITLNRPKSMNALDAEIQEALESIIKDLERNITVGCIVITGSGRSFSAGGDLKKVSKGFTTIDSRDYLRHFHKQIVLPLVQMEKVVIAAVNGYAVGAGFNLALLCDLIYASEDAIFSQAFINIGVVSDLGGMYYLPRVVGLHKAKELMFSGKNITAVEAFNMGIVNKVLPANKLLDETLVDAKSLASSSRTALGLMKNILNQSYDLALPELLELEAYAQSVAFSTEEHKEKIAKFFKK